MIKKLARDMILKFLRTDFGRQYRHTRFLRSKVSVPPMAGDRGASLRVLVVGVYMADRVHTVEHLTKRFKSTENIRVDQRWMALGAKPQVPAVAAVTVMVANKPEPKFSLVNVLLQDVDLSHYDYIIAVDDDIYVPEGFLPAFIAHQRHLNFSVAQPARALHSYFDHAFALRRPWLRARQTLFVECGPLVSFDRQAARLLIPFDKDNSMWGIDLVWAEIMRRNQFQVGIIDAIAVDHSLRPQAQTYRKQEEETAMNAYLASRPHIPMASAFKVIRKIAR